MVPAVVLAYNKDAEVFISVSKPKEDAGQLPFHLEIIVVDNALIDDAIPFIRHQHPM